MPNYIYALHCPIANTVRYVGKSVDPSKRLRAHIGSAKRLTYRHHTSAWLRKLLAVGLEPELLILEEVPDGGDWQSIERFWISQADAVGWCLTNSTFGGEGLDYICPVAAARYRNNHAEAMRKYWAKPGSKEKAAETRRLVWETPGVREKRAASIAKHYSDPDNRIRAAEIIKEINSRPEVQKKLSEARRKIWATEEGRAKFEKAFAAPEVKRKQSQAKKKTWADPEARKRMGNRWTAEAKEAQATEIARRADKMKASITPEVLARRNASIKASWDRRKAEKREALSQTPT